MHKTIYIDFEEINLPHSKKICNLSKRLPFMYTMYCIQTHLHVTKVLKFNKMNYLDILRKNFIEDLNTIMKGNYLTEKFVFVSWNNTTENKWTRKLMNKSSIKFKDSDLYSLDLLTLPSPFNSNYFKYFKEINKIYNWINEKDLNKNGYIASCIGSILYAYNNKMLDDKNIQFSKLKQEVKKYNQDDIKKMLWVGTKSRKVYISKIKEFIQRNRKEQKQIISNLCFHKSILLKLRENNLSEDSTYEDVIFTLKNKKTILDEEISSINKKLKNENSVLVLEELIKEKIILENQIKISNKFLLKIKNWNNQNWNKLKEFNNKIILTLENIIENYEKEKTNLEEKIYSWEKWELTC